MTLVRGSGIAGRRRVRADVVVVGTGAGGAVVAKELAEGGLSVVMLEEGERVEPAAFTARPRDDAPRHYRDAAMVATVGNVPIMLPLGRAVGGTTILNSATCYRTPPSLLAEWGLWSREELDPYFRRVERIFNVHRVSRELAGRNAHAMERGARALGCRASTYTAPRAGASAPASARSAARAAASSTPATPTSRSPGRPAQSRSPARGRRRSSPAAASSRAHAAAGGCASTPASSSSRAGRSTRRCC